MATGQWAQASATGLAMHRKSCRCKAQRFKGRKVCGVTQTVLLAGRGLLRALFADGDLR